MARRKRGRPTVLTPELIDSFIAALKRVWYTTTAADLTGIGHASVNDWIKKGRKEDPPGLYRAFYDAVKKTIAESTANCLDGIGSDGAWQAKAWLVERRHPGLWGGVNQELKEIRRELKLLREERAGPPLHQSDIAGDPPAKKGRGKASQ